MFHVKHYFFFSFLWKMFHVKHKIIKNSLKTFHVKHFKAYFYLSGSFAGKPAFLGYFFEVFCFFSIFKKDLPISVPGS